MMILDVTKVTKNKKVLAQLQTNELTVIVTGKNDFYFEKCALDWVYKYFTKILYTKEDLYKYCH